MTPRMSLVLSILLGVLLAGLVINLAEAQTITFNDGSTYTLTSEEKVIVISKSVNTQRLIEVKHVPAKEMHTAPTPLYTGSCTPAGQLSTGTPPCEEK